MEPHPPLVLVAEDEPQLLRLETRLLEEAGYEVVGADDGETALAAVSTHRARIAAAVLDAAIGPRGCGEIVEALARARRGVGIVLASGDTLEDELRRLMLEHDGHFLRKPFAPTELLRAVKDAWAAGGG